ncbi:MAG: DUF2955 domain-containing protein [Pseudomonadota bacterium]
MSPEALSRRNAALRLAFAITVGLLVETARGAALPTLGPIIALQLLAGLPRPPGAKVMAMLTISITVASALAYAVAALTVDDPLLYLIGVGLLYLWGFTLAFTPRLAPVGAMVITMTVVITGIATASTGLAFGVMISLVQSVVIGLFIVLLAHAVLPSPVVAAKAAGGGDMTDARIAHLAPTLRAVVATLVILPAHVYLFSLGTGSILVLMTTATMLRQPGLSASARYSISFAAGNLVGAAVAAVAMLLVATQQSGAVMITVTLACSLVLAWLSALGPLWRGMMVPGMVAFVVLYGLVYSPYVDATDVSVTQRALMVVAGALYALGAVSVLSPLVARYLRRRLPADRDGGAAGSPAGP